MKKASLALSFAILLVPLVACIHQTAELPGVLDLRSDGSSAAPNTAVPEPDEEISRDGFGSYMSGEGTQFAETNVSVEERTWWVWGLLSVVNDSYEEEFAAALGDQALRDLRVGSNLAVADIVGNLVVHIPAMIPGINCIGGPVLFIVNPVAWTVTSSGERIRAGGSASSSTDTPNPTPVAPAPPAAPVEPAAPAAPAAPEGGEK